MHFSESGLQLIIIDSSNSRNSFKVLATNQCQFIESGFPFTYRIPYLTGIQTRFY